MTNQPTKKATPVVQRLLTRLFVHVTRLFVQVVANELTHQQT